MLEGARKHIRSKLDRSKGKKPIEVKPGEGFSHDRYGAEWVTSGKSFQEFSGDLKSNGLASGTIYKICDKAGNWSDGWRVADILSSQGNALETPLILVRSPRGEDISHGWGGREVEYVKVFQGDLIRWNLDRAIKEEPQQGGNNINTVEKPEEEAIDEMVPQPLPVEDAVHIEAPEVVPPLYERKAEVAAETQARIDEVRNKLGSNGGEDAVPEMGVMPQASDSTERSSEGATPDETKEQKLSRMRRYLDGKKFIINGKSGYHFSFFLGGLQDGDELVSMHPDVIKKGEKNNGVTVRFSDVIKNYPESIPPSDRRIDLFTKEEITAEPPKQEGATSEEESAETVEGSKDREVPAEIPTDEPEAPLFAMTLDDGEKPVVENIPTESRADLLTSEDGPDSEVKTTDAIGEPLGDVGTEPVGESGKIESLGEAPEEPKERIITEAEKEALREEVRNFLHGKKITVDGDEGWEFALLGGIYVNEAGELDELIILDKKGLKDTKTVKFSEIKEHYPNSVSLSDMRMDITGRLESNPDYKEPEKPIDSEGNDSDVKPPLFAMPLDEKGDSTVEDPNVVETEPEAITEPPEVLSSTEETRGEEPILADEVAGEEKTAEKNETPDFSSAVSFDDVYQTLRENDGLIASFGHKDADYWIEQIEEAREEKKDIGFIATTGGLRGKVEELMEAESKKLEMSPTVESESMPEDVSSDGAVAVSPDKIITPENIDVSAVTEREAKSAETENVDTLKTLSEITEEEARIRADIEENIKTVRELQNRLDELAILKVEKEKEIEIGTPSTAMGTDITFEEWAEQNTGLDESMRKKMYALDEERKRAETLENKEASEVDEGPKTDSEPTSAEATTAKPEDNLEENESEAEEIDSDKATTGASSREERPGVTDTPERMEESRSRAEIIQDSQKQLDIIINGRNLLEELGIYNEEEWQHIEQTVDYASRLSRGERLGKPANRERMEDAIYSLRDRIRDKLNVPFFRASSEMTYARRTDAEKILQALNNLLGS